MATYLVTGGTGSFGRAFIKTILRDEPDSRIVSISRNAEMRYRLEADFPDSRLIVLPGDVRVPSDLAAVDDLGIDTIIHCAAEKHVTTGQRHGEYVRAINVGGAINILQLAHRLGISRVLALSTDKACAPIANVYGQSKADAEQIFINANSPMIRMSVVRYGNVVGSSGSVIPLFLKQRESGRLTVTDRRMTRFWMPISDDQSLTVIQEPHAQPVMSAVRWVRLALQYMTGGEIFVPEIPSASVMEIAAAIAPQAEIVETGIRDGEKVDEDLISLEEGRHTYRVPFGGWAIWPTVAYVIPAIYEPVPTGFSYNSAQGLQPVRMEIAS